MAKRLMDILLAGMGLLVLLPLFIALAAWIRLDSPGPVFFRQERVGRHGRVFRIHKFRTMVSDPRLAHRQITVGADPRITRAGQWLRHSKLDELPQLIDVLRGDMSLVGPRPEVPRYVAQYPAALREKVLSVRPGITDLASLEFRRESELLAKAADPEREYVEVVMPQKLRYAAQYVDEASLATDLRIIGLTLKTLVSG
ncbi:sugar transferase [Methylibium rhizosphaerae]|uniref:sugar transferase n=1 Tax=Methylibium rhizosphaerae TaxID=2570323 RepID=UPI00112DE6CA|nr:sugar transferase [Methylibium rhizosphaerae]